MSELCDFGCGAEATHWCWEWDGALCDLCCVLQNVSGARQVIPCDYNWWRTQLLLPAEVICGVDMSPDDEPGHYICDEKPHPSYSHHMECHQHHDPEKISCEATAEFRAIDEELYRYAIG